MNTCIVCPLQTQKKPGTNRGQTGDARAAFCAMHSEVARLVDRVEALLGVADELERRVSCAEWSSRIPGAGNE